MSATANRRAFIVLLVLSGTIISICMGLRQSLGLFVRPDEPFVMMTGMGG